MKRFRDWLLVVLVVVGLGAVGLGGYVWQAGTGIEVFKLTDKSRQTGGTTPDGVGRQSGETGIDGQIAEGEASYSLRGHFVVGPTVDRFGRLTGRLVATGDKAGREVEVLVTDHRVYLGIYDSGFDSRSEWRLINNPEAVGILAGAREVELALPAGQAGDEEATVAYHRQKAEAVGRLKADIKAGGTGYQLPSMFIVVPTKIGVVSQ